MHCAASSPAVASRGFLSFRMLWEPALLEESTDPRLRVGLPSLHWVGALGPRLSTEWAMDPSKWVVPRRDAVGVGCGPPPLRAVDLGRDPLFATPLAMGGGDWRGSTTLVRGAVGGVDVFLVAFLSSLSLAAGVGAPAGSADVPTGDPFSPMQKLLLRTRPIPGRCLWWVLTSAAASVLAAPTLEGGPAEDGWGWGAVGGAPFEGVCEGVRC